MGSKFIEAKTPLGSELISIIITSCNRKYYLKNCIESFRECIKWPNLQWIIIDNASVEPGLKEYIENLDFVEYKIFREKRNPPFEQYKAKNIGISLAKGDYVIDLQEDHQFIRKFDLQNFINIVEEFPDVGIIQLSGPGRKTFETLKIEHRKSSNGFPFYIMLNRSYNDVHFTKRSFYEKMGPFIEKWKKNLKDGIGGLRLGGGEYDYQKRFKKLKFKRACVNIPLTTPEVPALVRGDLRYGKYFPPPHKFYFKLIDVQEQDDLILCQNEIWDPWGWDKKDLRIKGYDKKHVSKVSETAKDYHLWRLNYLQKFRKLLGHLRF